MYLYLYPPALPSMANVGPPLAVRRTGLEGNLLTRLEMLLLVCVYVDPGAVAVATHTQTHTHPLSPPKGGC